MHQKRFQPEKPALWQKKVWCWSKNFARLSPNPEISMLNPLTLTLAAVEAPRGEQSP